MTMIIEAKGSPSGYTAQDQSVGNGALPGTSLNGPVAGDRPRWMHKHPLKDEDAPLFVSRAGKRLSYSGMGDVLRYIGERAGVPDCRPHRFRHTWTLKFLAAGGQAEHAATILGHSGTRQIELVYGVREREDRALAAGLRIQAPAFKRK